MTFFLIKIKNILNHTHVPFFKKFRSRSLDWCLYSGTEGSRKFLFCCVTSVLGGGSHRTDCPRIEETLLAVSI